MHTMHYTIQRSWSMEFRIYSSVSDADVLHLYCKVFWILAGHMFSGGMIVLVN